MYAHILLFLYHFRIRMSLVVVIMLSSLITVALSNSISLVLLGVGLTSFSAGLAEISMFAYSALYDKYVIILWPYLTCIITYFVLDLLLLLSLQEQACVCVCLCMTVFLSVYGVSVCLFVCLPVYLCMCVSVCLSVCLCLWLCTRTGTMYMYLFVCLHVALKMFVYYSKCKFVHLIQNQELVEFQLLHIIWYFHHFSLQRQHY